MAYWLRQLENVKQCDQRQDSMSNQLKDLILIADRFGFYDASDYLKAVTNKNKAETRYRGEDPDLPDCVPIEMWKETFGGLERVYENKS